MHKTIMIMMALAAGVTLGDVVVDASKELGRIKPMNAVNNGPKIARKDQSSGNDQYYKAARIPYARNHDGAFSSVYGAEHAIDVSNIFPNFDADENDPKSYDFVLTDKCMKDLAQVGTKCFYRLGQKIEHNIKKYGILPPKDYAKWARICEHIIAHYNEGWANGFKLNIEYWEIWNEPDLDDWCWQTNPRCWGGPKEEFFKFFEVAAKHLKARFPNLKIGGPALAWNEKWAEEFLKYQSAAKTPLDFFSWHCYTVNPRDASDRARRIDELKDAYGYGKAESILNEWNYVRGWSHDFIYSCKRISDEKGGAFTAAFMVEGQNSPADMLMYYDARPGTVFNGLFDLYDNHPHQAYWALYAWSDLAECGTQVKCEVSDKDVYAVAAKDKNGKTQIFVTRYSDADWIDEKTETVNVKVCVAGCKLDGATVRMTDADNMFADIDYEVDGDAIIIPMKNNSFALIKEGARAKIVSEWENGKRQEVLDWFRDNYYGRAPLDRPADETFGEKSISFGNGKFKINLFVALPKGASKDHPVPVFIFGDHSNPATGSGVYEGIPTNSITARGYAYICYNFNDVAPNTYHKWGTPPPSEKESWSNGVFKVYGVGKPNDWGTLSAWAWGFSRVMDWIETRPELDAKRVAIVGHSRGGKTALWAAAQDERIALGISNNSGTGGARLLATDLDLPHCEHLRNMLDGTIYFWFCPAARKYIYSEMNMPHDADDVVRLVAPRLAYIASAASDLWAGPQGEFETAKRASELYRAYGKKGISLKTYPAANTVDHSGHIGYHVRAGGHKLRAEDWEKFMDYADKFMK